ncbi:MAG TPA: signal peptidase I [Chloroflexota bacterium]|nr:signal peptidase I [Chloroflexota bacterium]HUM71402.1 signal peptidase I [Chloroflexota bacterium]
MSKSFSFLAILLLSMATACGVGNSLDSLFLIHSQSMEPTLPKNTILGINEQAYSTSLPQRGDIVLFDPPHNPNPDILFLSRIIGLPGETVEVWDEGVFVNGTLLNEPYLDEQATYKGQWQLGENEYFILADNRNSASDSHNWGSLPFEYIIGKAVSICSSKVAWSCNQEIEPVDYAE